MITIRKARENEVSKIQQLNQEVFIDNQQYDSDLIMDWAISEAGKKYFTSLLNDSNSICLVAEDEEKKLVGYIAAAPCHTDYRKSKYIEVENMGVIPPYRSKGIGRQLMDACLEWAKEYGYQKAHVNTYFHNLGAVRFYKRHNFSEMDLVMSRDL